MSTSIALDTTAYTAFGKGNEKTTKLLSTATEIGLPIIVLGEIFYGIFDGVLKHKNQATLRDFLNNSRVKILHIDEATAKLFGEISAELKRIGKKTQQNDIWIAALCKQYGYVLVTADAGFLNITGLETVSI